MLVTVEGVTGTGATGGVPIGTGCGAAGNTPGGGPAGCAAAGAASSGGAAMTGVGPVRPGEEADPM